MPRFVYIAKSDPQKSVRGTIDAGSKQDAVSKLNLMGYFPISLELEREAFSKDKPLRFGKISGKDIVVFTRQLSGLISSGVNILNSLGIISKQASNKYLKNLIIEITDKIKDGKPLSESMAVYPYVFSPFYTSVLHSGEISGNIDETLSRLADFLESEDEFRSSIALSFIYPLFVLFVGVVTVGILLVFAIPRLAAMFEDMGQVLPLPTRLLIGSSGFLRSYGWIIIIITLLSVFLSRRVYHTQQGRLLWDSVKLKTIALGPVILKTQLGRLMRTLALMVSSGISITVALDISETVLENSILKLEVKGFKEQINNGSSFSEAIKSSKFFAGFIKDMVTIGEETGSLDKSFLRIADTYEKDAQRSLKALTRMIEPVIILVMGIVVGFIVLSMLLPIFQINLIVS